MEEDFICPNCQEDISVKTSKKEIEECIFTDCPFCNEEIELGLINLKKGFLSNLFLEGKISYEQGLYYEENNENLKKIINLNNIKLKEIEKIILNYSLRYKENDLVFSEEYDYLENEYDEFGEGFEEGEEEFDNFLKLKKLVERKLELEFEDFEFVIFCRYIVLKNEKKELVKEINSQNYNLAIKTFSEIYEDFLGEDSEFWINNLLIPTLKELKIKFLKNKLLEDVENINLGRGLENFEQKLLRTNKKISKKDIEEMSGIDFEKFIGNCFEKKGYNVKVTKATGDQGADLILEDERGILTAVQVKKYSGSVGNKAVQEVVASMKFYDCDKAMIVTTETFTKSAFQLASKNGVQLIDKKGLDDLI